MASVAEMSQLATREPGLRQVALFAATRWEWRAVRRSVSGAIPDREGRRAVAAGHAADETLLVRMGVGTAAVGACRSAFQIDHVGVAVSTGFAGALVPSHIGELLIATEVLVEDHPEEAGANDVLPCATALIGVALEAARAAGLAARAGRFVAVPRVLWRAADKRETAARTGAIGVDMESAVVGRAARERDIPFVVIRAVSDLLDEDLPLDFNWFLSPVGWTKGAIACLRHPSRLLALTRFRSQVTIASERLTDFFNRFLPELRAVTSE